MVVVFPAPWRPTRQMTLDWPRRGENGGVEEAGCKSAVNSSTTARCTNQGDIFFSDGNCSMCRFMFSRRVNTNLTLTSASMRAREMSESVCWTCSFVGCGGKRRNESRSLPPNSANTILVVLFLCNCGIILAAIGGPIPRDGIAAWPPLELPFHSFTNAIGVPVRTRGIGFNPNA
jgi:hypothetical protein